MVFHVFVDGVTGTAPQAMRALADAMAAHYGVPADDLYGRLVRGPFRVKTNCDRATAEIYLRDLQAIGAVVRIERAAPPHAVPIHGVRQLPPVQPSRSHVAPAHGARPMQPVQSSPDAAPATGSASARSAAAPHAQPAGEPAPVVSARPTRSGLPPQPVSAFDDSLPVPGARPTKSALPPQPVRETKPSLVAEAAAAARQTRPSLESQTGVASRPSRPSLLAEAEAAARQTRPSLEAQAVASRPSRSSLLAEAAEAVRQTRPSLDAQAASAARQTRPSLASQTERAQRARPSLRTLSPESFTRQAEAEPQSWPVDAAGWGEDVVSALGALDDGDLALMTLDNAPPPARATGPGAYGPPASAAAGNARMASAARSAPSLPDLFAPPDELESELAVDLADDELAYRAGKQTPSPGPGGPRRSEQSVIAAAPGRSAGTAQSTAGPLPAGPSGGSRSSGSYGAAAAQSERSVLAPLPARQSVIAELPRPSPGSLAADASHGTPGSHDAGAANGGYDGDAPAALGGAAPDAAPERSWLADPRRLVARPRVRFAAGVVLAIVLGFLPADAVAAWREHSELRAIDAHVSAVQSAADTQASYDALDRFRAEQLAAKQSKQRMIALTSLLVWAVAGSAFGYVWFCRIRWDRAAA